MDDLGFSIRFVLAVLATWRVTHLLAHEDGPVDLIVKFRALLGDSLAGKLMDCFKCLSLWIAAPAAVFVTRRILDWLMVWLAVSGAACLLERLGREAVAIEPVSYNVEGDEPYVPRTEAGGTPEPVNDARGAHGERGGA